MAEVYKRADHCISCELGEGSAILDSSRNIYFTLNAVGAAIWALLEKPASLDDIVAMLQRRYSVDRGTLKVDAEGLLRQLSSEGLILSCG